MYLFILGYEFADDDYDLDENEKSEGAKQAGDDSSGVLNIANGEIKKLTEEIAPKEKVATPPVQKVTPPLEPITEHSDEADKSIPATKPGKRLKPYGNEIALYNLAIHRNYYHYIIICISYNSSKRSIQACSGRI